MAKNNHLSITDEQKKLSRLLRQPSQGDVTNTFERAISCAEKIVELENCIAVVSNLVGNSSRIIAGKFAGTIGLSDYESENSIWESRILSMMTEETRMEKFIAELRFFHYLRNIAPQRREEYCLFTKLRFVTGKGSVVNVLHRMHYLYDNEKRNAICAICLYSPLVFEFSGGSYAVNTLTGLKEELSQADSANVLSRRERQILSLIDSGMKSREIAVTLNISIHTVHRHRQEILARLNVKNSHEACRIAKSMSII